MKALARRNTHVKYESPSTYQSKVVSKVNDFEKVTLQDQRSGGQGHGIK
jgi:ribosomal protein L32E